jgi:hypothetical protein
VEKYEGALKKYKTPEELLKGMGNLQGLVGTDTRGIIVPKEDSPPDVVAQFKQAVGAPESAEGYELSLPEGLPESVQINEDVVGKAKEIAAKYHMPAAALQELMTLSIGHTAESATAMQEALQAQAAESREAQMDILKKTWKGDLDKNLSLAARVGVKLEIPEDDPVFTSANGVRLLVEYAKTQREDSLPITGRDHAVDVKADFEDMVRNIHHPLHHRYHTDPEFARQQSERLQRALANAR